MILVIFGTGNLLSAAYGSASTWAGPNFSILTGENAPFEAGPLTKEQASLVVSMPCFGAIIGTVLYTMLIDRFSRKLLLVSIAIPEIVIILQHTNFTSLKQLQSWKSGIFRLIQFSLCGRVVRCDSSTQT